MSRIVGELRLWGLILLLLTARSSISQAQNSYYVAINGNDNNSGRSVNVPFQSLAKVNSLSLVPGDTVLFRRGDTFRGSLVINRSGSAGKPIVFDAYGSGAKPSLVGSVLITNWTSLGNNIWQADCPDCGSQVTGLYRNAAALPLGRYPNPDAPDRGYLTVQTHVGNTQLTSQQPLMTDWTGAEAVLLPTYWIIDRATITQQSGNALALANTSGYPLTDGWGFFIQNHPATLDQPGEWYYNPTNKTIRLFDKQNNPNTQLHSATVFSKGVHLTNASFVSLRNLRVTETLNESLLATNVSNLTFTNVEFTHSGEDGVIFLGSGSNILMENTHISDINNNGFYVSPYHTMTFRGSSIRRVGLLPGRGKSGDGNFTGLQSYANDMLIENSVVDSIGYNGITFRDNTTIRQNIVSHFCMVKSDGGGLYAWNGTKVPMNNIHIVSNIIHSGVGTPGGLSNTENSGAHGIFLDDCVQGVDIQENSIFNCNGLGFQLHAVSRVSLIRNTCFNNSVGQLILYNNGDVCQTYGNTIQQNIFLTKFPYQGVVGYFSSANDLSGYGAMGYNYYARPFNDTFTIRAVYNQNIVDDLALPQWQAQFGQDLTSKTSPITYNSYILQSVATTNRLHSFFDRSGDGWDTWSSHGNGRAVWDNTNRLDNGSLRIDFTSPAGPRDSYVLVYKTIQAVTQAKSYVLRFDAVASVNKKIEVFIRQQNAPYQDLTLRYTLLVGPIRKQYELAFTALADDASALLTFQTREDSQALWLDNIRLQDATITPVNPADHLRLVYNPTLRDSLVTLADNYRDVKNHYHGNRVILKPFTSVALLKDPLPSVDIRLSLDADKKILQANAIAAVSLRLHNESGTQGRAGNQVRWICRLPANLTVINGSGLQVNDSVLTGTVQHLALDTTFVFHVRSVVPGTYTITAQVTTTTYADPDSTPDSGIEDGEDDMALIRLVVDVNSPTDTAQIVTGLSPVNQPARALSETRVFPNPTIDSFTIVTERPVQALTVVDLFGRQRLHLGPLQRSQSVEFGEQLPAGVYLLYIRYDSSEQRVVRMLKAGK